MLENPGLFGVHAVQLRLEGFAVLPAVGKTPLMSGFSNWKVAPGGKTVDKWAAKHPDADIVYVPGLSQVDDNGKWRVIVIDADDAGAVQQVRDYFGDTPGRVNTRRGKHFLYRVPVTHIERIKLLVGKDCSLKRFGINADIKLGKQIVVAPPSRHELQRDFSYAWDGCDPSVIHDLPILNLITLDNLIDERRKPEQSIAPLRPFSDFPQGSRGLMLNNLLCAQVSATDSETELLDIAREINEAFMGLGHAPLDEAEVVKRAGQVWRDFMAGKIAVRHNRRARAFINMDELDEILATDKARGDAAAVLLMKLRGEHSAREARGENFAISDSAMVRDKTLPGWHRRKIREARDVLMNLGFLKRESAAIGNKRAAQYRLITQAVRPGLARRKLKQ